MQKVPLSMVQPGMVLEKPVTRENGMTLIGAGTEPSEGAALATSVLDNLLNRDA